MKHVTLAAATLVLATPLAAAQESAPYIDAGVQYLTTEVLDTTVDVLAVNGRLGYDVNRNFGFEVEAATGLETWEENGVEISLDYAIAGYGRLKAPLSNSAEIYGKIGYAFTQFDAVNSPLLLEDEQALVFGTGITFLVYRNTGIRLDYSRYTSDIDGVGTDQNLSDLNVDSFALSLYQRF